MFQIVLVFFKRFVILSEVIEFTIQKYYMYWNNKIQCNVWYPRQSDKFLHKFIM